MDYVIAGGGVYGCYTAWALARQGAEVLLLEADEIAAGASGGPGKRGVRANGRDLRELPLMRLAYDIWPSLHEAIDHPTGYERIGHLQLIERPRDLAAAPAIAWMQERQGIPTQLLSQAEVRALEPHVSERVIAALHCPLDGVADHTATTHGLAEAAKRAGAQLRTGGAVTGVERSGGQVAAVVTGEGERIPVGKALILLTHTHVPGFLNEQFGVTLPAWSRLPQAVFVESRHLPPLSHLIGHAHRRLAMKPGPRGTIWENTTMVSGGWLGRWNQATGRGEVQPDQVAANVAEAVAVFPMLADAPVLEAFADRPECDSADRVPIIDRVPGSENVFFATGWAGHGWAIAPAVSELLAGWILGGERPDLLRPFGCDRFERGGGG
jgi:sarcosine oxidase subunit beta